MPRKQYYNGDPISLRANGCDGCSPSIINGKLCHEQGCPEEWKDREVECAWCGQKFFPTEKHQECCDEGCQIAYNG